MAYSSISLITLSAVARATVLSAGSSFRSLPESGTCFTRTMMFIALTFLRTRSGRGHAHPPGSDHGCYWLVTLPQGRGSGDEAHPALVHSPVAAKVRSVAACGTRSRPCPATHWSE